MSLDSVIDGCSWPFAKVYQKRKGKLVCTTIACNIHDMLYIVGGQEIDRYFADKIFYVALRRY